MKISNFCWNRYFNHSPQFEPYHEKTFLFVSEHMSLVMRKPAFSICENKDADQLHSNCAADQRNCFRYIDTTIPLLSKSEISSF